MSSRADMEGNKWGTAIKCPLERQKAFKSFCDHIADGYPMQAWSYRNGEHRASWETMMRYVHKDYADEFDAFLIEEAKSKSYFKWFKRGEALSDGKIKGNPSPQTWATIMRNKFKWDRIKPENETSDTARSKLQQIKEFLFEAPEGTAPLGSDKE